MTDAPNYQDPLLTSSTAARPEDRWAEDMRRRLLPNEVETILVSAMQGDLRDQSRLFEIMADTWPRLQHNLRTIRDAAASAPFAVHAASYAGAKPDPAQEAAASLLERAMYGLKPDARRLEVGFEKACSAIAESTATGHAVVEILWHRTQDQALLPRAFRAVSAGWYSYPYGITSDMEDPTDRLQLRPGGPRTRALEDFPANKFLVSIQPGHAGHPAVSATLRSLAKYWVAAVFGLEWMMSHAQLFNIPFRWANYPKGDKTARDAVAGMLANIGTAGWAAFPEGVKMQFLEAQKSAGDLPAKLLGDIADAACDILLLGQTLTSDAGDGGGSYALGAVHRSVRSQRLESICREVAVVLTEQLVPAVLHLNLGTVPELCPEIRVDMPETKDAKSEAERDRILLSMGMPLPEAWLYERHGVPLPDAAEPSLGFKFTAPPPPPQAPGSGMGAPTTHQPTAVPAGKDHPGPLTAEERGEPADPAANARAAAAQAAATTPQTFVKDLADVYETALAYAMELGWEEFQKMATAETPAE